MDAHMCPCGTTIESRTLMMGECEISKEERDVLVEMRKLDECDVEEFGRVESSEKTIAAKGDRWWPHTAKQEGDRIGKQFLCTPGVTSDEEVELSTALVGLEGAKEGCIEQAEKKVLISPPVADHDFEHAFERLAGTAEFDDAMDSWSRCMNGQGYELGDVWAPGFIPEAFFGYVSESHGFDVEGLFSDPSPKGFQELREIEIEVASASVACLDDKRDTLLGSWSEIMGEPIG